MPNTVPGVQPPITPRTNLATVTYPVSLATESQLMKDSINSPFNIDAGKNAIPQFSILLRWKNQELKNGSKTVPVFAQLNKICGKHNSTDKKATRKNLLKELKFAGIAFTGIDQDYGDGSPNMIASAIGGSHTVMSYRHDHGSEPLKPGTVVRWTLPEVDNHGLTEVPVSYHGTGRGIFAELEQVNETTIVGDILSEVGAEITALKSGTDNGKLLVQKILQEYFNIQEREIGVVISDNGRGSIDLRLK